MCCSVEKMPHVLHGHGQNTKKLLFKAICTMGKCLITKKALDCHELNILTLRNAFFMVNISEFGHKHS